MTLGLRQVVVFMALLGPVLPSTLIVREAEGADVATTRSVPSVVGLPAKDAKAALQAAGLATKFQVGKPAARPSEANTVYAVEPGPGTRINNGTVVIVTLHAGAPSANSDVRTAVEQGTAVARNVVHVPSILGSSAKDAKAAIAAVGLVPKFKLGVAAASPTAALTAYEQQPIPGTVAAPGSPVTITLHSRLGTSAATAPAEINPMELTAVRSMPFVDRTEETIDPRTGRLFFSATDLVVPAGAIKLEVRRTLQMSPVPPGLLGRRWRLNWESRLLQSKDRAVIESEGRQFVFNWDQLTKRFSSSGSDYLLPGADGRTIWVRSKDRVSDTFDQEGRFVERDARNGNKVTLSYDSNGRPTRIAGPHGISLELRCDENGRLTEIEASTGSTVHYTHSSSNTPLTAKQENGEAVIYYAYNPTGGLERIEHPQLGVTRFAFDAKGRVTRRTWADGSSEQFYFDDDARTLQHTDASGQVTTTVKSPDGRFAQITTPLGHTSVIEYDKSGRTVARTGPTQQTTRFTFDDLGRTVSVENPSNGTTHLQYVGDSELVSALIGPGEHRQLMDYDAQGNLLSLVNSADPTKNATFEYAADGQIASVTAGNGQKQVFTYDSAGRRESVVDAAGNKWRYEYDSQGNPTRQIDPLGAITQYTFDAEGRLTNITNPNGATIRYAYEQRGRLYLVTTTDERGGENRSVYDQRGRLMSKTDAAKRTTRYEYDAGGRLASMTGPAGESHQFQYDALGNLTSEINPLGGVVKRAYDPAGNLISVEDPAGAVTRFEYSPAGNVAKIVDPSGLATTYAYNEIGQLVDETSFGTQSTQYEYEAAGRLTRRIPPTGPIMSFEYDNIGNQTTVRRGDKVIATYEYDALGRRTKETQAGGLEITYRYDSVGNLVERRDSQGGRETFEFDAAGRPVAVADASGASRGYQYDPAGNILGTTDPLGKVTKGAYNVAGELVEVIEANGDRARYEYDAAGLMAAVHHPGGGKSSFEYDGLGNPLKIIGPLGNEIRSTYDAAGQLLTTTDAKGQLTKYTYDKAGRLSEKQLASGKVVRYQYDQQGNLISVDDGQFPIRYAYDADGNPIRIEYPAIKRSLNYEYNAAGLKTKFTDSEGGTFIYQYDDSDRLTSITLSNNQAIAFAYDPKGRVTSVTYPNGVHGVWKYDADDRPTELVYTDGTKKTIASWAYKYDAAGNCVQTSNHDDHAIRYAFDPSGQLVEENRGDGEAVTYGYGVGGNRVTTQSKGNTTEYRYNEADQLLSAGNEALAYDANGNLIERKSPQGVTRYEYDAEDQLVKVVLPDKTEVSYGYSPTGERIWRRDSNGLTWFVNDGVDLVAELNQDLKPQATFVHGARIDQPLMMTRGGKQYYFHPDRLGSIHRLTDSRGNVAASYDYDAFGQIKSNQGSVTNPFTYTAREFDAATGLFYYRNRYYDAKVGRFLGTDPVPAEVGDALSLNLFAYARNNPIRFVDASGLAPKDPFGTPYTGMDTEWLQGSYERMGKRAREVGQGKAQPRYDKEWSTLKEDMGKMRSELERRRQDVPQIPPQRAGTRKVPALQEAAKGTMKVPVVQPSRPPGNLLGGGVSVPAPPGKWQKLKSWADDLVKPAAKWIGEKTLKAVPIIGAGVALTGVAQAAPEDRAHEIAKAVAGELPFPLDIPGEAVAGWVVPPGSKQNTGWVNLPLVPGSPAENDEPWIKLDPLPETPAAVEKLPSSGGWVDLEPLPGTPAAADEAMEWPELPPDPWLASDDDLDFDLDDLLGPVPPANSSASNGDLDGSDLDRARAADADVYGRAADLDRQLTQDERRDAAASRPRVNRGQGGQQGHGGQQGGDVDWIGIIDQAIQQSQQQQGQQGQHGHP